MLKFCTAQMVKWLWTDLILLIYNYWFKWNLITIWWRNWICYFNGLVTFQTIVWSQFRNTLVSNWKYSWKVCLLRPEICNQVKSCKLPSTGHVLSTLFQNLVCQRMWVCFRMILEPCFSVCVQLSGYCNLCTQW